MTRPLRRIRAEARQSLREAREKADALREAIRLTWQLGSLIDRHYSPADPLGVLAQQMSDEHDPDCLLGGLNAEYEKAQERVGALTVEVAGPWKPLVQP